MQLSLDDLITEPQHHRKVHSHTKKQQKPFGFGDIVRIGIVILSSFLLGNIITNAGLYGQKFNEFINGVVQIHTTAPTDNIAFAQSSKKQYLETLFAKRNTEVKKNAKDEIYSYYNNKSKTLERQFNTLPPDRRIVIPELGIQAPIVNVEGDIETKMKEGEFTEELKKGVALYPTAPDPTKNGTMFLFGHTSNYFRIKSAYNNVFSKIPQLKAGNTIKVYRDGKEYEYKVKEQEIVKPSQVPDAYAKRYDPNKKNLLLMGCYPVGTRTSRVLIYAEPVETVHQPASATNLAYHPNNEKSTQ